MNEHNTKNQGQAAAFQALFNETIALFHRLRWSAENLHEAGEAGHGRRRHAGHGHGRHGAHGHGAQGQGGRGRGAGQGLGRGRGRGRGFTAARRGILLSVRDEGPQTVPDLARSRRVSRQHVQSVVNSLEEAGLIRLVDNPAHKRSRLVELTEPGHEAIEVMLEREMAYLGALDAPVPPGELLAAAATLRRVRQSLQASPAHEGDPALRDEDAS